EEFKKDLSSGHSLEFLRRLSETGLLEYILPEISDAMLVEGSPFSESLSRIDEHFINKEGISHILTLAIIALYSHEHSAEGDDDLSFLGKDSYEIHEHVRRCFAQLTVPRREREQVETILQLWHQLLTHASERRVHIDEFLFSALDQVLALIRILPE